MKTYRQKGYCIRFVTETCNKTKTNVTTLTISKKGVKSKYIIVKTDGDIFKVCDARKLLQDVNYRNQFIVDGYVSCNEQFSFFNSKGATIECERLIRKFYRDLSTKTRKPTLNDYRTLVTFGKDEFSKLGFNELVEKVNNQKFLTKLNSVFDSKKRKASVLRWLLRGLKEHDAIQRVLISIVDENEYRNKYVSKHIDKDISKELCQEIKSKKHMYTESVIGSGNN